MKNGGKNKSVAFIILVSVYIYTVYKRYKAAYVMHIGYAHLWYLL